MSAERQRAYRERQGDALRERERERGRTRYANGWREDPDKQKARVAVRMALQKGILIRKPCEVCGDSKSQAHHEDYLCHLDVVWLCRKHHEECHPREKKTSGICRHCGNELILTNNQFLYCRACHARKERVRWQTKNRA